MIRSREVVALYSKGGNVQLQQLNWRREQYLQACYLCCEMWWVNYCGLDWFNISIAWLAWFIYSNVIINFFVQFHCIHSKFIFLTDFFVEKSRCRYSFILFCELDPVQKQYFLMIVYVQYSTYYKRYLIVRLYWIKIILFYNTDLVLLTHWH